ncbi:hypothetical protein GCM10010172_80650 [Paractinoplanes ferrugineus]|uniref:Uncharacterized protein n=1 Tax=Paractinoplanes ferrugineus TaxID=113564 RepID=A0A919J4E1_9ACTN|nr:hypothetical protein [Actinoplanes ferrugineus]GIE10386.1 hypothetical protein Afe05nite_22260 [Actinoplanes ferrugineus]
MVEFGSIADWIQAGATVGALTYVAVQFRRDRRRIAALEKRDEEQRRKDRDQQAHNVCTELVVHDSQTPAVVVTNYSDKPIRNVTLLLPVIAAETEERGSRQMIPIAPVLGPRSRVRIDAKALVAHLRRHPGATPAFRRLKLSNLRLSNTEVGFRNVTCRVYTGAVFERPELAATRLVLPRASCPGTFEVTSLDDVHEWPN